MNPIFEIMMRDEPLGVISWSSLVNAYVLQIPRRQDLPLSFNVWTKVGDAVSSPSPETPT